MTGSDRIEIDAHDPSALAAVAAPPREGAVCLAHVSPGGDLNDLQAQAGRIRSMGWKLRVAVTVQDGTRVFDHLVGRDGGVGPLLEITKAAQGLDPIWLVPLSHDLVHRLQGLVHLAEDHGADFLPVPDPTARLSTNEQLFAWDFVTYRLLGAPVGTGRRTYLKALGTILDQAAINDRVADLLGPILTAALTDEASSAPAGAGLTAADFAEVIGGGIRAHMAATIARLYPRAGVPEGIDSALLIGAYGGDHIGDLAILGGVLRRLHERLGLAHAVLMTQRVPHTAHLVAMMKSPVDVKVVHYDFPGIRHHLGRVDAVVYAGGPLTDIPKQLVRHLYAAATARRMRKPFLAEGIGPNDFPRRGSAVTARRMITFSDYLSVRTSDDASRPVVRGLNPVVGRDPAFDYLETLGADLSHMADAEDAQITELLRGTEGRALVGVNIRPINELFTATAAGDRQGRSRSVVGEMERALAEGMARMAETRPTTFIFFPMNAIEFGMSDLKSAYRIVRHLPPGTDARVWESDATLDGVVALLRRLDTAITMRFHAAIFALSQGIKPIGIDYRIGKKDKVAALMDDAGEGEFCCRIDQVDAEWIADRLIRRAGG